jgi:putative transcriptional regulator
MIDLSLSGSFLVAMPDLKDSMFSNTVVFMCEHNENGALGIIINLIYPFMTTSEIFDELKIKSEINLENVPLHIGGPVQSNQVFVLHGPDFNWEVCLQVNETLALSNSIDIIDAIAKKEGPEKSMFALGCSGWGPGQLETEIQENSWLTLPASNDIIFDVPIEDRWKEAIKKLGFDPAILSSQSGNA